MSPEGPLGPEAAPPVVLALRLRPCAKALGISPRHLQTLTDQWEIPHCRLGKRLVVYPVDQLRQWLAEKAKKAVMP